MNQFFINVVASNNALIPSVVEPNPANIPNGFDGELVFKLTTSDAKFDVTSGGVKFESSGPFEIIEASDTEYRYEWTSDTAATFHYVVFLESPFLSITNPDPTVMNDPPGTPPD